MLTEQQFALGSMHWVYMAINKADYTSDFMNIFGGKGDISIILLMFSLR